MLRKENRRIRYTKMVLRESLLKLMKDRPASKISVSALCEDADISRGTFYQHYLDTVDLLHSVEQELYNLMYEKTAAVDLTHPTQEAFEQIFLVLYQNRDLCSVLCGQNGDKEFLLRILDIKRDYFLAQWNQLLPKLSTKELEYIYTFSSAGIVALIENWVRSGYVDTPRSLGAVCSNMLKSLVHVGDLTYKK